MVHNGMRKIPQLRFYFQNLDFPRKLFQVSGMNFTTEMFRQFLQAHDHRAGYDIILSVPEQWSGGSMHKICETHNDKMP